MKILVLLGGDSPERDVSLRSGKAVADSLKKTGRTVYEFDPARGYEGLDEYISKVDVVMPILHGVGGEDGSIQRELESRKFKFLGSGSTASEVCFNKVKFKEILNKLSILTPKYEVVNGTIFKASSLIRQPYVLKPIEGGSSVDTFIIRNAANRINERVFSDYPSMLLEELIEGTEITVPVLGEAALPVIEIIPPAGKEFDYENKYNGASQENCPPKNVDDLLQQRAQRLAEALHKHVGARHVSRTDMIIDKTNNIYVLEINTMPGMTGQSLFPRAAAAAGLNMETLVDKLAVMAAGDANGRL